ncbi:MAG TPA: glycosyltransferase [Labilithrix sp.]|nr:glycosyltransferase [Labilithrix sp.]
MSRRFAVVNLGLGSLVGIDGAVRGMAKGARNAELPIDVIALVPGNADDAPTEDAGVRCVPYAAWSRAKRLQSLFRYRAIASARLDRYDVVFLRYPITLDLDPMAIFRRPIAERIATVHHSSELRELWSGARTPGMAARVALEWVGGRRVLSRVSGIVGVTDEIRALQLARAGRRGRTKPSAVVSNGIDVENVPFTRFTPFDGKTLRLVLVASSIAPWHGWDRLKAALASYRGAVRVVVDAVGRFDREKGASEQEASAEIRYHGLLKHAELSGILTEANVAVSSLAMFRAGLTQGCVLKTREYTARGLPFIYAYDDVDLRADDPFCLRLPTGEEPVAIEPIIEFAARLSKTPDVAEQQRQVARTRMDWSTKMRLFDAFGSRLLG